MAFGPAPRVAPFWRDFGAILNSTGSFYDAIFSLFFRFSVTAQLPPNRIQMKSYDFRLGSFCFSIQNMQMSQLKIFKFPGIELIPRMNSIAHQ